MTNFISRLIIFAAVLAYLVGNVYRPTLFVPEIKIGLLDIVVIFALGSALLFKTKSFRSQIYLHRYYLLGLSAFIFIALLSLLFSLATIPPDRVLIGSLYLIRFTGYALLFITLPLLLSPAGINLLTKMLILITVFSGIVQYALFPDIRGLAISDWDPHYYRVVGTFLDPGFTAIIYCFIFFRLWFKPIFSDRSKNWFLLIIVYLLLAFTYSRSGYLAFLAGWAYLAYVFKSFKKILIPLLLVIFTVLLLPRSPGGEGVKLERTSSITARLINWGNSLQIFLDHPVIGVGLNNYRYVQKQYGYLDSDNWLRSHAGAGADSSLLFTLATTGLLGMSGYLVFASRIWKLAGSNIPLRASLVGLLVHSLFLNSLYYPFILFWVVLGLLSFSPKGNTLH